MLEKRIQLFKLFGFKVNIDLSWFILAVFITWSLAKGVFPEYFKGLSNAAYWWMGVAGALGLFFSIIFHEFCHSIIARFFGLQMKGITLFIFGGVAEMEKEPESAKAEFLMAIAGPISSVFLATVLYFVHISNPHIGLPAPVDSVIRYLIWLNYALAIFNLIPAFPLDGGRVLRSILWGIKGNLRWATQVASNLGSGFGLFLIVVGILRFIGGDTLGGVWSFLIGLFIKNASQMSYKQLVIRKVLEGEHVRDFMKPNVTTIPASASIEQFIHDYLYHYHFQMFPVLDNDRLIGCITAQQIKQIPREQWDKHTVKDLAKPCSPENTIPVQTDAIEALSIMNRTGNSRLMVLDTGRLVGIVTLKDMLQFLSLKIDLEGDKL